MKRFNGDGVKGGGGISTNNNAELVLKMDAKVTGIRKGKQNETPKPR